jgi:diguanylate cyclase (GGDEF)-like protein
MSSDTILAIVMVASLAAIAIVAAIPGPLGERLRGDAEARTRRAAETPAASPDTRPEPGDGDHRTVRYQSPGDPSRLRPAALDRIIRVGTWVFLFAVTTMVVVTDLWGDRQGAILVLLGAGGLYTFVIHDLVPRRVPEAVLLVFEGGVSVLSVVTLIALTGGATSPFFFALPLIVVGAATVVAPGVTLGLTAAAALAYLVAVLANDPVIDAQWLTTVGINLTALGLIAYVGMAIGREQRRARDDANLLATIDQLTGLRTRPFLFNALDRELARSQRTGRAFCVLMIDMDDLKGINDRHGHLFGDRALRLVGAVIRAGIRRIDTGARFGGDEFVVLLPETDPTGGWVLAEKVRRGVAEAGLDANGERIPTSVSVGLVTYPQDGETADALLEAADEAMYRSKRGGRDRTTRVPVMDVPAPGAGRASARGASDGSSADPV